MANDKGLIAAVASVGVGLGILTATLGTMILSGQDRLAAAIESNGEEIGNLRERIAQMEGRLDTAVEVFAERDK